MTIADFAKLPYGRVPDVKALCESVHELMGGEQKFVLLAGGTDYLVELEMRTPFNSEAEMPFVIDISNMPELREVKLTGPDSLRIGSGASYLSLMRHADVIARAPLLAAMGKDVGAVQIQARGTLGGNLATGSPAADGVAALAAFDASVVVDSVRGSRVIPFSELQTGYKTTSRAPDEVIVAIDISLPKPGSPWYWRKVGTRRAQAISKVALAAVAEVSEGQVVRCGFGMASVAPVTALLERTRELLLATRLAKIDQEALDKCVERDVSPIDDVRSDRVYRLHVAKALVRDFVRKLSQSSLT